MLLEPVEPPDMLLEDIPPEDMLSPDMSLDIIFFDEDDLCLA